MPPMRGFGESPGDRVSAAFLQRIYDEMQAARTQSVAPPLLLVTGPTGNHIALDMGKIGLRRFRYLADLAGGGSASAQAIGYDFKTGTCTAPSEQFTVYDSFGKSSDAKVGKTGQYGLAQFQVDASRWEVLRGQGVGADDFFPAKLSAKTTVAGIIVYSWTEYEFTAVKVAATAKSGGRSGTSTSWPAVELNNADLDVTTSPPVVWMRRVFVAPPAVASLTKTATGNNGGVATAFSLYVDAATGLSYTVTFDGSQSATIAFDASAATTKATIEATVTGLTLSAFAGSGTLASPWTFSVTSDTADHQATTDAGTLKDASGYAFSAEVKGYTGDLTVVTDVTWDADTCEMTKTTHTWTFVDGILTVVT